MVPSGGSDLSGEDVALLARRGVFQAADGRWVRAMVMPNGGEGSTRLVPVDPQALLGRIPERALELKSQSLKMVELKEQLRVFACLC